MKKIIICLLIIYSNTFFAQEKSNLQFKEGIYAIEVNINNGKDSLELNTANKIQIISKNIDLVNMMCVGRNLKRGGVSNDNNISIWDLTIIEEGLKEGKYSLMIAFRGRKGKRYTHEFLIPIKQN